MKLKFMVIGLFVLVSAATSVLAVPTQIAVRVKAKDAKFVGTSMGGALVLIRNVHTGELLAKGHTSGGTGNTAKIMKTPVSRGVPLSDESAAAFIASIDIDEPTLIEVSAYGPSAGLQSANRVSSTQWVIPGKHITAGDGWVMELPGFAVKVNAPGYCLCSTPGRRTSLRGPGPCKRRGPMKRPCMLTMPPMATRE
jgi:hypothetical protein